MAAPGPESRKAGFQGVAGVSYYISDHTPPDTDAPRSLVNLLPNGPNDGGFIVCRGGHRLSEEYHKEMKRRGEKRIPAW